MGKFSHLSLVSMLFLGAVSQGAFLPVCERTEPVKKSLEMVTKKVCADILEVDLLSVKRIVVRGITAFKADDFSGLHNLDILNIRSNKYTEFPEGLFTDLENLKTLVIISTTLQKYPEDFLEHTPLLENLHAFRNKVTQISDSVLYRLEGLKNIKVIDFDKTLEEPVKARLREFFPEKGKVQLSFI